MTHPNAMAAFSIEIDDRAVRDMLYRLARGAANPKPALEVIGEQLYALTRKTFETSTSPWGETWRPTKKGNRPLIGAGRFLSRASLSHNVVGNTVTVGSTAVYAAIHQFGGQAGRGKKVTIPARPFMPVTKGGELSPAARQMAIDTIEEYLASLTR